VRTASAISSGTSLGGHTGGVACHHDQRQEEARALVAALGLSHAGQATRPCTWKRGARR
jgi:hypothetical protein